MIKTWLILSFLGISIFWSSNVHAQPTKTSIRKVLGEINDLRASGCVCGGRWMPPVDKVSWDGGLYKVSNKYARYMAKYRHFDHVSKSGEDLGDRLDNAGYDWMTIGENLAHGYNDFFDVLQAWKDSPSHCKMLMHADMNKMGLSKHKMYWVQSFSGVPKGLASSK